MNRYALKGSMRQNADLSRTIHHEIYTPCQSLPNFCPACDYTDQRNLWFRRGAKMFCHKCGYQLCPKDYWHSEIVEEIAEFDDFIL